MFESKINNIVRGLEELDASYPEITSSNNEVIIVDALKRAAEARKKYAYSYRGFTVGAAALALSMTGDDTGQFITGVNYKPAADSPINIHAEQQALERARAKNFSEVSVIAIVGPLQNDSTSGLEMNTLHPCGLCRTALHDSKLMHPINTIVATALPDLSKIEVSNIKALSNFHDPNIRDESGVKLYNLDNISSAYEDFSQRNDLSSSSLNFRLKAS